MGDEKQGQEDKAQQEDEGLKDLDLPEETAEQVKGGQPPNKKMPSKFK